MPKNQRTKVNRGVGVMPSPDVSLPKGSVSYIFAVFNLSLRRSVSSIRIRPFRSPVSRLPL